MERTEPDIIGIVGELQKLHHALGGDAIRTDINAPSIQRFATEFPSLAQALLIAVEALEAINDIARSDNDIEAVLAQEALSRIRSLPAE